MSLLLFAVLGTIDACPKVWVIDTSAFPAKPPGEYRVTVHFDGPNTKGELPFIMTKDSEPDDLPTALYASTFHRKGWEVEERRLAVVFRAVDGTPARRIWVESTGPKPAVRWEFAFPPKT